eukprot:6174993-Pleurochrysis_carterae.AAC.1
MGTAQGAGGARQDSARRRVVRDRTAQGARLWKGTAQGAGLGEAGQRKAPGREIWCAAPGGKRVGRHRARRQGARDGARRRVVKGKDSARVRVAPGDERWPAATNLEFTILHFSLRSSLLFLIYNCFASRLGRRRHVFVGEVAVSTVDDSTRRTAVSILEPE